MKALLFLIRWSYSALFYLATPLILLRLLLRSRGNAAYRHRLRERFGRIPFTPKQNSIWIHAVSVGEVMVASTIIKALQARHPEQTLFVTTITPTGSAQLKSLFPTEVEHCYLPYDQPHAVNHFLDQLQPRLCILIETELWPNVIHYSHERNIPIIMANARLSPKSARGYGRAKFLMRPILSQIDYIGAQTQLDAERFVSIGAAPEKVKVIGNLKYDIAFPEEMITAGKKLRQQLGENRPVWVAGSTHDGEEAIVLEAHKHITKAVPDVLLILVPRHPERAPDVKKDCESAGWRTVRYSAFQQQGTSTDILLGDTIGDLRTLLASADVAFIGGSLVPIGGHNLLEPAALGLPILTGPHMFNFTEVSNVLHQASAAKTCRDANELARSVTTLLQHAQTRHAMGAAGKALIEENKGATDRLFTLGIIATDK